MTWGFSIDAAGRFSIIDPSGLTEMVGSERIAASHVTFTEASRAPAGPFIEKASSLWRPAHRAVLGLLVDRSFLFLRKRD